MMKKHEIPLVTHLRKLYENSLQNVAPSTTQDILPEK